MIFIVHYFIVIIVSTKTCNTFLIIVVYAALIDLNLQLHFSPHLKTSGITLGIRG